MNDNGSLRRVLLAVACGGIVFYLAYTYYRTDGPSDWYWHRPGDGAAPNTAEAAWIEPVRYLAGRATAGAAEPIDGTTTACRGVELSPLTLSVASEDVGVTADRGPPDSLTRTIH